ncbi:MAG: FAD:protein FMN transferase [Actinomycetota bacterium]|nr:FAD:protein FMN transferase [Actinomycetota bacterium]
MSGLFTVTPFAALGTTAALVLTDGSLAEPARDRLRAELDLCDRVCSRFRDDSELEGLNRSAGRGPVPVSDLLLDALDAALRAARLTGGLVDPTVGRALNLVGYDRDFGLIAPDGPPLQLAVRPVPGWRAVTLDRARRTVALPPGVRLDLGATAKALCADRAARSIAGALGGGVLVSLGGDVAVAGPAPVAGWPVRITNDHAAPLDGPGPVVAIHDGGLATSSTSVRRWRRGGRPVHHLIDPHTSAPAGEHWSSVSVAAASCLDANIASCAAMIMGPAAPAWLRERRLPARLVPAAGPVQTLAGWPGEELAPCS